ncbi:MAG TPA: HD-GYP domain-containing protein [Synergistaceae bacterium]|nr:HD-GYP domain-containing protein [Synergistaceae bacterium]
MIKRYQRAIFLSVFFALLLTALVGGALFLAHHKTVERHLEFARELLVKDVTQRFETLFEGYLYWDAMVHAAEKGHEDFLEEQFDDMEESYGLREWLLEKDGRLLYRFGSSLLDTSLLHSLAPEELEIHPGEGKEILFVQKLPLLFEDGTPSKFYALMGITDLEVLHTINTFLGTHLMITQSPEGIPLSGEYHLQEESVLRHFLEDATTLHTLGLTFFLMAALLYSISVLLLRRHSLETQLFTMSMVLEKRDSYTSHHSCKVADNARVIARAMGLSSHRQDLIVRAGLLHDVGKLFSPDAILLKKGKLSPEEFAIIKQHPGDGADMVENILKEHHLARIIREHHERYDGSGYPKGISGKEILLEARILAVADVVDAMLSDRPYHEPRPPEEVREHLLSGRGTLYDPVVVDAALQALPENVKKPPTLPSRYSSFLLFRKRISKT